MSALFSAIETAFSSANQIRIKQMGLNGNKRAIKAYYLIKDFTSVITAVLICNNIFNILATSIATFVLAQYFNEMGVVIATVVMTIVIVAFTEITPKLMAKEKAENIAVALTPFILIIVKMLSPIIKVAVKVEDHFAEDEEVTATEEELIQIVHTIEQEGVLDQDERELIESAINFDDKTVREIMKPRIDVVFLFNDATEDEILEVIKTHKYSRIPIVDHEKLHVIGIIRERDVLECLINDQPVNIDNLMRNVISLSQRTKLAEVLEQLQKSREHLAIVVENKSNNNFVGIVTLEDVLEELVGEIYDEYDDLPNYVIEIGHHTYHIKGSVPIRQFFDKYLSEDPPETRARNFTAWLEELAGGKKIRVDREFKYENYVMKVISVDKGKVMELELLELSKNQDDFEGE